MAVVDILSDLEGYSGRRIEVGGQITNLRTGTFRSKQPQYTFDLSDGMRSILVFGSGSPPCPNGATAVVVGTLGTRKRANQITGTIDAVDVQCR